MKEESEHLIISWPNIIKANSKSNAVTSNIDFYPTIVDALGIQHISEDNVDGISIKNVLENPNDELNRESIFWHYPLEKPHFLVELRRELLEVAIGN